MFSKALFGFFLLLLSLSASAQAHEAGLFFGGSNFSGDVGQTDYLQPKKLAYGLLYRWNAHERYSLRFNLLSTSLLGNDNESAIPARQERGYVFENELQEITAGLEFHFFNFNLNDRGLVFTPYLFGGIGYARAENLYYPLNEKRATATAHFNTLIIPAAFGAKIRLGFRWVVGLEAAMRFSLNDNLDGSYPKNVQGSIKKPFGSSLTNDWYFFSGLTISYTFGKPPCYCL